MLYIHTYRHTFVHNLHAHTYVFHISYIYSFISLTHIFFSLLFTSYSVHFYAFSRTRTRVTLFMLFIYLYVSICIFLGALEGIVSQSAINKYMLSLSLSPSLSLSLSLSLFLWYISYSIII